MSIEAATLKGFEKTLELIKASGWQTAAIAASCGLMWWLITVNVVPTPEPYVVVIIAWGFFLFSFLTIAAICAAASRVGRNWLIQTMAKRAFAASIERAIPFMTEKEREIVGHLLHHNSKVFEADHDGGYAASLLGRRFITILAQRGQSFDLDRVPMIVPDPVWEVWKRHQDKFPYKRILDDGHEVDPWRISWKLR